MLAVKPIQKETFNHWTDLWFSDHKQAGFVGVSTDYKKNYFYGKNDIKELITKSKGIKSKFITLNAFTLEENKTFKRKTENLKQIRNIGIDIDQYSLNLSIEEALDEIQAMILSNKIPEPNLVLTSRGIQLIYSIDKGASPQMVFFSRYITEQFVAKLEHLGADHKAKDVTRYIRVAGSVNERNNAIVEPHIWNNEAYTINELLAFCRPLEQFETRKRTKFDNIGEFNIRLYRFHKTNSARLIDLEKLLKLRKGNLTGCRNNFVYVLAFHQSFYSNTQKQTLAIIMSKIKDIYTTDNNAERMTRTWIENTVKSAYKDAKRFFEHFKTNGYNVIYKQNDGIIKPYKTSNLIKMFNIKESEQYEMRTIRNQTVAKEQHARYMKNKRRSEGVNSMEFYNKQRKSKQAEKITILTNLLRKYPEATNKDLATELNVSTKTIQRLIKKINK